MKCVRCAACVWEHFFFVRFVLNFRFTTLSIVFLIFISFAQSSCAREYLVMVNNNTNCVANVLRSMCTPLSLSTLYYTNTWWFGWLRTRNASVFIVFRSFEATAKCFFGKFPGLTRSHTHTQNITIGGTLFCVGKCQWRSTRRICRIIFIHLSWLASICVVCVLWTLYSVHDNYLSSYTCMHL